MIIGIGTDLIDIRRVEKSLKRFGSAFEERMFTEAEIARANGKGRAGMKYRASILAKRIAAKEAFAKALGTGIGKHANWKEIEVINLANGEPSLRLHGAARERLKKITPRGRKAQLHLSMTDEYPFAQAFVVISCVSA